MSVTIYPYIHTQQPTQQKQASATDSVSQPAPTSVSSFKDYLSQAERTVGAMAIDALIAAKNAGTVSSDTVQQILSVQPQNTSDTSTQTTVSPDTETSDISQAVSSSNTVSAPADLNTYFEEAAEKYNVDANLLKAIAKQESNFNPSARSSAGAMGIMQLMPSTAKSLGITDAYNAHDNIMGGAQVIAQNLKKYNGDVSLALAAYNAGSGNVDKYGGIPPFKETQNYVKKVLAYYQNT